MENLIQKTNSYEVSEGFIPVTQVMQDNKILAPEMKRRVMHGGNTTLYGIMTTGRIYLEQQYSFVLSRQALFSDVILRIVKLFNKSESRLILGDTLFALLLFFLNSKTHELDITIFEENRIYELFDRNNMLFDFMCLVKRKKQFLTHDATIDNPIVVPIPSTLYSPDYFYDDPSAARFSHDFESSRVAVSLFDGRNCLILGLLEVSKRQIIKYSSFNNQLGYEVDGQISLDEVYVTKCDIFDNSRGKKALYILVDRVFNDLQKKNGGVKPSPLDVINHLYSIKDEEDVIHDMDNPIDPKAKIIWITSKDDLTDTSQKAVRNYVSKNLR